MKKIHLVCNAHLDPVWLWEWEEGAAEAISTFRVAADFCEEYDGFVFNHNEVILYKWVEEYEPALFRRIQDLVKKGKWHIMGGWYLQPDCNMPSGESFVRQCLMGRIYFKEKFGVKPTTAINFDPFGHSRGLVQILKKSGYDSYLFCRPGDYPLESNDFIWVGYDGSKIQSHRAYGHYLSGMGKACEKIENFIKDRKDNKIGLVLWGIGNHGGGPSRIDLDNIRTLMEENKECKIIHSVPEAYFKGVKDNSIYIPEHDKDLNPFATGCYTSQVRIKQKHRLMENDIYMTEKMMSSAAIQHYIEYPEDEMHEALCDLMMAEFHDILPGSSIQPVEDASLRLMDHGLEIVSRLKARAFFALASGQEKAEEGQIPILIYNPHPYKVKGIFECEFQLQTSNKSGLFAFPAVYRNEEHIASQVEQELSNLNFLDWRKRIVFAAELEPGCMNRFDCRIELISQPEPQLKEEDGKITFITDDLEVVINCQTGLMDEYKVNGVSYLKQGAFCPAVIEDSDDAWGMWERSYKKEAGKFKLMSEEEGTKFSGVTENILNSVRVIEDGEVRSVIEVVFSYGNSFICQRYKLPKQGTEIEVEVCVLWNEKSKLLKLLVPTTIEDAMYMGQDAYGVAELWNNGNEVVAQKWVTAVSKKGNDAFTCINDGIYGSDFCNGVISLSLLRSPGYSGHPSEGNNIMPQDRYSPRIDQGERFFRFWFNGGSIKQRLEHIDREALAHNEKPFALSFFPSGKGKKPKQLILLSDDSVQMTAFKKAENSGNYIIRLFEPTGQKRSTVISLPAIGIEKTVEMGKFEIKTLKLDLEEKTLFEVDLMES